MNIFLKITTVIGHKFKTLDCPLTVYKAYNTVQIMLTQHGSTDHMTVTYIFSMVYKHQLSLLKKLTDKSFVSHTLPAIFKIRYQMYIHVDRSYIYLKKNI